VSDKSIEPGEVAEVQGYELSHDAGQARTVVVDDQGAVHLPEGPETWLVGDVGATAPITHDPDPVEDPAGNFELVDGTWRRK
jgi:hypothetical protein